jgi:hypothetical protein
MHEHKSPAPTLLDEMRKNHRLPGPGGEGEKWSTNPAKLRRDNGVNGFLLIGSDLKPHGSIPLPSTLNDTAHLRVAFNQYFHSRHSTLARKPWNNAG